MRLLDINATFFSPPDRHDDREHFFLILNALGPAERASESQYYVLTSDSFDACVDWLLHHVQAGDFLKVQDVAGSEFALLNAPSAVENLLLEAEGQGVIVITRKSTNMLRITYSQFEQREGIRRALAGAMTAEQTYT